MKGKSLMVLAVLVIAVVAWFFLVGRGPSIETAKGYWDKAKESVAVLTEKRGQKKDSAPPAQRTRGPQPVSVLTLSPQTIRRTEFLPGRIVAYRQSQVRPQVEGVVKKRLFEEGTYVQKGQQLYQIDDARYEAALARAKADLEGILANAKMLSAKARRYERLARENVVSQQQYEEIQAQYELEQANIGVARAAVDTARIDLDFTKVYAPISGQISRSFVTEGALVTAGQEKPMAVITQLDPVFVDMQLSGSKALSLHSEIKKRPSTPVRLWLNENKESLYGHNGTLKLSEVTVDESAGSITLRAVFPNPEGVLLPGLFVHADLDLGERKGILLVPQRAAIRMPDGSLKVWVVKPDNSVESRTIQVSQAYKEFWILTDGLEAGETIVVEGYEKIGPGSKVAPSAWKQEDRTVAGAIPGGKRS